MNTKPLMVAAAILAVGLGVAQDGGRAQAQEAGGPKQATLKIEGEPGTEYSGRCVVGGEKDDLGGRVPQQISYAFMGEKIECEVRQQSAGALRVVLETANDRSEQRVSSEGGTIKFAHSEDSTTSSTTSSSSVVSQQSSSLQTQVVVD